VDKEGEELIRRETSTGRPLAGEGFVRMLERMPQRRLMPKPPGRPKKGACKIWEMPPYFL